MIYLIILIVRHTNTGTFYSTIKYMMHTKIQVFQMKNQKIQTIRVPSKSRVISHHHESPRLAAGAVLGVCNRTEQRAATAATASSSFAPPHDIGGDGGGELQTRPRLEADLPYARQFIRDKMLWMPLRHTSAEPVGLPRPAASNPSSSVGRTAYLRYSSKISLSSYDGDCQ